MRCPCCGASGFAPATFLESLHQQIWKVVSLVSVVGGAIIGQAELVGEPWRHYLTIGCVLSTALIAWRLQASPKEKV